VPRPEARSDGAIDDFARAQGDDISTLEKPLKELGLLQVSCLILICLAAWVWMFVVWLNVLCIADGDLDFDWDKNENLPKFRDILYNFGRNEVAASLQCWRECGFGVF